MNQSNPRVLLASQSPRRSEILKSMHISFDVEPALIEEVFRDDYSPIENVLAIAEAKARWVAIRNKNRFIIGADTIVVLEDQIMGKPTNKDDAHHILSLLSGKRHKVITGVVVLNPLGNCFPEATESYVKFKEMTSTEINNYIETGEPMDKAGAYAIQGKGSAFVESYSGSWSNIVGLPIESVQSLLQKAGHPQK
ncbi:MAG: Maf family protein [Nitrospinales bacterium]